MDFSDIPVSKTTPEINLLETGWTNSMNAHHRNYYEILLDDIISIGEVMDNFRTYSFSSKNYIDTTYFERESFHAGDILSFTADTFDMAILITEVSNDSKLIWGIGEEPPITYIGSPFSTVKDTNGNVYVIKQNDEQNPDVSGNILPFLNFDKMIIPTNFSQYSHSSTSHLNFIDDSLNPRMEVSDNPTVVLPKEIVKYREGNQISPVTCVIRGLFSVHRSFMEDDDISKFQCLNFEICFDTNLEYKTENTDQDTDLNMTVGNLKFWRTTQNLLYSKLFATEVSWFYQGGGFLLANTDRDMALTDFHVYTPYFFTDVLPELEGN